MVYFIVWEMHGFTHQFPTVQENATKPIVWGEPEKLVLILFLYGMGVFFPLDSHSMVYFITWEMYVFSHHLTAMGKGSHIHRMGIKPGKLVPGNILQNPSYWENLGNWHSYFSHSMVSFFHLIAILWYTLSHAKCMGFPINFP